MPDKRVDFYVGEAGCLIWIAPRSLGGLGPAGIARVWEGESDQSNDKVEDLVRRGVMMPMSLYQDDGYSVRFVLGDLTAQEEAEWVARAVWKLDVPCGEVLVSGILTPDFEREFRDIVPAEEAGSYWAGAYVSVPPGSYRVEVTSYPPGDLTSGWGMITDSRSFGRHPGLAPEKRRAWFERTRPCEAPPAWLDDDPDDGNLFVDFIVRLMPLVDAPPVPRFEDDGCIGWEFRKPELFPLGIRSKIAS